MMRILAAVFWFAWAGVIVPGHTRGIITINDEGRGMSACASACCHPGKNSRQTPDAPLSSKNCAVCAAAAKVGHETIDIPAALKLGFIEWAFVANVTESPSLEFFLSLQARGPPDSASHIDRVA